MHNHVKQGFSLRILCCVVDTGYWVVRSLGDCRHALPKGPKYKMVKTQTESHKKTKNLLTIASLRIRVPSILFSSTIDVTLGELECHEILENLLIMNLIKTFPCSITDFGLFLKTAFSAVWSPAVSRSVT